MALVCLHYRCHRDGSKGLLFGFLNIFHIQRLWLWPSRDIFQVIWNVSGSLKKYQILSLIILLKNFKKIED